MGQAAGSLGFAKEALAVMFKVFGRAGGNSDCLDGNGAVDPGIARAKHRAHGAAAKLGDDLIPP
jgi:hypothetical protein